MKFRLLGPLEAVHGERPLALGGRKQRALLARLLMDVNRTVAAARLIDDLWGENVPDTAGKMVQVHVSRLRKVLPTGVLVTRPPGYALEVEPDDVNVTRFTRLRAEGRAALLAGDARRAASRLHEALSLWRGPPLAEFPEPFAGPEAARLEQLHLGCLEDRIEADLMLGHTDVVGELEVLIGRLPLREHLRELLMVALYRSGRQAEALSAYGDFRRELDDQLGLEPSASLKQLERRLLRQDPELDVIEAVPERSAGPNRTRLPPGPSAEAEVRYARSGRVAIAFQVLGEGALDLVLVHGWVCSFQPSWEREQIAVFYRRLASMGRLILFDKRGTGLSDRVGGVAPWKSAWTTCAP